MEATKEATKVVPLVSTTYEIVVRWYKLRRIGPDGPYSYGCLDPGKHLSHEKHNLSIDCLMPEEGKLVCKVSCLNEKKRPPTVVALIGKSEQERKTLPFYVPDGGRFYVKGYVYTVDFCKIVRRLQAHISWGDKGMIPEGKVLLVHPSGTLVTKERSEVKILQAYLWQPLDELVVGMEIATFTPPARIVAINGNKATISFDPSHWVA